MSDETDESWGEVLFVMVLAFGGAVPLGVLRAWAIVKLWTWFVVPLGAPVLGMAAAFGISTLVALLTHQREPEDPNSKKHSPLRRAIGSAMTGALISLAAVGLGWVARCFQ